MKAKIDLPDRGLVRDLLGLTPSAPDAIPGIAHAMTSARPTVEQIKAHPGFADPGVSCTEIAEALGDLSDTAVKRIWGIRQRAGVPRAPRQARAKIEQSAGGTRADLARLRVDVASLQGEVARLRAGMEALLAGLGGGL